MMLSIENNGVTPEGDYNLFLSSFIVFNENRNASVIIAVLTLALGVNGPLNGILSETI